MNTKIIEWSRRFIHTRARLVTQWRRWYRALTPNSPSTVAAYTEVANAALADTVEAARAMSVAPVARDTRKDQKWIQPRKRGLGPGMDTAVGVASAVTISRLGHSHPYGMTLCSVVHVGAPACRRGVGVRSHSDKTMART